MSQQVRTFWLSMHRPYRCRDSGACCSAGWAIPVERVRLAGISRIGGDTDWLRAAPGAPRDVAGVLAIRSDGHCVFHETGVARRGCAIQHASGHAALPTACQHFPRECLIDRRGVSITLSHYCPTAADLLFTFEGDVEIVEGPAAIPDGVAEGLDVRDAWPPLLTPGMLMDDESYAAWEAHVVRRLTETCRDAAGVSPEHRVAALAADACELAAWRPGGRPLIEAVHRLPASRPPAGGDPDWKEEARLFEIVRAAVAAPHTGPTEGATSVAPCAWPTSPGEPLPVWQRWIAPAWPSFAPVINRFLAAHAFASWMAYQGRGIRAWVDRLHLALAVLRIEALRRSSNTRRPMDAADLKESIRQTDLLLVHLADRLALARGLSST